MNCLFCKIIAREIPAEIVFENDDVIAFLDIHPNNQGHTLIVPKTHSENSLEAMPKHLYALVDVMQKIAPAIMRAVGASSFNILSNTGIAAGQGVMHTHWHIIPRFENDGLKHWDHKDQSAEAMKLVVEKIRTEL